MKNYLKFLFFVAGISLLTITSCQNDSSNSSSNKLTSNSTLKTLLKRVTQKRTSSDNVIDSTNCFTVKLPVTVIVNGQTMVLSTPADYDAVVNAFNEHDDDNDNVDFVFPITVIFTDFTELVVTNSQQLHDLHEACESEDVDHDENTDNDHDDDAINCISFNYPLVISTLNNGTPEDITVNNDHEFYVLVETVVGSTTITINYPFSVVDANGQTITVNNNSELETSIENAIEQCGEHDGDNENDDDHNHNDGED
jgi:hypothetical protein